MYTHDPTRKQTYYSAGNGAFTGAALIYTAVLYGKTAPVMIAIVMHICNNKKVMGEYTNKRWSNVLGSITLIIDDLCRLCFDLFQFK